MTVRISGQVPADAQNGMSALEEDWTRDRTPDEVIAVVKIARHGVKFVDATATHEATMKFVHIEPLEGSYAETARSFLEAACKRRGGSVEVADTPLDLPEPDLDSELADQDVEGGE